MLTRCASTWICRGFLCGDEGDGHTQRKFSLSLSYTSQALGTPNVRTSCTRGGKMSFSDPFEDRFPSSPDAVRRKIKRAFCEEGNIENNGVLAFVEVALIPIFELRIERAAEKINLNPEDEEQPNPSATEGAPTGTVIKISRDEKYGGTMQFSLPSGKRLRNAESPEGFERRRGRCLCETVCTSFSAAKPASSTTSFSSTALRCASSRTGGGTHPQMVRPILAIRSQYAVGPTTGMKWNSYPRTASG